MEIDDVIASLAKSNNGIRVSCSHVPANVVAYTFVVSGKTVGTYAFPNQIKAASVMDYLRRSVRSVSMYQVESH